MATDTMAHPHAGDDLGIIVTMPNPLGERPLPPTIIGCVSH